ncbi:hypothetical protein HanRHA438_Chr06g0274611 [Helianthus annuus]|nr:hypothetical protein HanIR_Chr06g0285571 [Helianthus annuus]KAJ0912462.1 hypothetical protein HanRHA438_Chr06g0274611 [Helianthus annuus]
MMTTEMVVLAMKGEARHPSPPDKNSSELHFQNYGMVGIGEPMGIRVLSGVHFLEVLAYLLPLCNEDIGPVTPALIFRGVTQKGGGGVAESLGRSTRVLPRGITRSRHLLFGRGPR